MTRAKLRCYQLHRLGFHTRYPCTATIRKRLNCTRVYLIVYRFYGNSAVTWEQLSPELQRLWLVVFDTTLVRLVEEWSISRVVRPLDRPHLRKEILTRFRILYERVHQMIFDA